MTRTIHKYQAVLTKTINLKLPKGAEVLSVGHQELFPDKLAFWAIVDPDEVEAEHWSFHVRKTGVSFDGREGKLLGLVSIDNGRYIYHVFFDEARVPK